MLKATMLLWNTNDWWKDKYTHFPLSLWEVSELINWPVLAQIKTITWKIQSRERKEKSWHSSCCANNSNTLRFGKWILHACLDDNNIPGIFQVHGFPGHTLQQFGELAEISLKSGHEINGNQLTNG